MKISENSLVKCAWCKKINKAVEWNEHSRKSCTSREMRRAFKNIYEQKVWGPKSDNYYKCPSCNLWSLGNQLRLMIDEDTFVPGYGGRPLIQSDSINSIEDINKLDLSLLVKNSGLVDDSGKPIIEEPIRQDTALEKEAALSNDTLNSINLGLD